MTSIFVEPLSITEDWLSKNANTFTFATLCSLVGLNSKNRSLSKDHVKSVRRKLLLRYHPDKCNIPNANAYFRFYKDCLDQLDVKFESFSFFTETKPAENTPPAAAAAAAKPKPTAKNGYSTNAGDNSAFFSKYGSSSSSTAPHPPSSSFSFTNDHEFKAFLAKARQEELRKNASAYSYESQEQTGNRFANANNQQQQQQQPHSAPKNAEEINNFFQSRYEEKLRNYEKPTAKMAQEYENMFGAYQQGAGGSGGSGGGSAPKFSNERFEDMLRNTLDPNSGGGGTGVKKVKPVSLLSNSSSSRLDYAQSLFDGNQVNQDNDSSIFLSGGSKNTYGLNVRDAHDPRKHLMSQGLHGPHPGQHRTAQQYENMRNQDIFQHATSKQEQEAFLAELERKRQLRNQERLYRMYAGSV